MTTARRDSTQRSSSSTGARAVHFLPLDQERLPPQLVLTCEHAGKRIPRRYRELFRGGEQELASHRGYDLGAWQFAKHLGQQWDLQAIAWHYSRLLIEPNRSLGHPQSFSPFTRSLHAEDRQALIDQYFTPHRCRVEREVERHWSRGATVWHLAIHSFTPVWKGKERRADLGLLYDPTRDGERELAVRWIERLRRLRPELTLRRNYPYLGKSDGLTTYLRQRFPDGRYLGIEVELNQQWWTHRRSQLRPLARDLALALPQCGSSEDE